MSLSFYENHIHKDPDFPIIFHLDIVKSKFNDFTMHWHESIELLYFIEGEGAIICSGKEIKGKKGDLIVINSNDLHCIKSITLSCSYYCLIIDKNYCNNFGLNILNINIKNIIKDSIASNYFEDIIKEMKYKNIYYKSSVKVLSINLLIHLIRNYIINLKHISYSSKEQRKIDLVKSALNYINSNYRKDISIDTISSYVGCSKYYFCHVFKEITGKTIISYINYLRCNNARKLLASGNYNVYESAELNGFNNMSYFSKTYKKYMGKSPSKDSKINFNNSNL